MPQLVSCAKNKWTSPCCFWNTNVQFHHMTFRIVICPQWSLKSYLEVVFIIKQTIISILHFLWRIILLWPCLCVLQDSTYWTYRLALHWKARLLVLQRANGILLCVIFIVQECLQKRLWYLIKLLWNCWVAWPKNDIKVDIYFILSFHYGLKNNMIWSISCGTA